MLPACIRRGQPARITGPAVASRLAVEDSDPVSERGILRSAAETMREDVQDAEPAIWSISRAVCCELELVHGGIA
jgi:hypothetical protein